MFVTGQDYAALRLSGRSPAAAKADLELSAEAARAFERGFLKSASKDIQVPRFALHDRYVATVLRLGGFCAFSERRRGRDGVAVCLPLIWPA